VARPRWLLVFSLVACTTCEGATEPCVAAERLLTTADEGLSLRSIDPDGRCAQRRMDLGGTAESVSLTPDGVRAYVVVRSASDRREVVAIDVASFTELSRASLSAFLVSDTGGSAATGEAAAVSSDGSAVYLWRSASNGVVGIGRFDLASMRATAFSGPWNLVGLVPLKPSALFPQGALVVVGLRSGGGPTYGQSRVYFLDPLTLVVKDSILPGAIGGQEEVWQFLPTPDARTAYIAGRTALVRYDLVSRSTIASIARQAPGMLSTTADGSVLILTDAGTWPDSPGSGLLRLYDANLSPLGTIDISTPLGGVTNSSTATRSGASIGSRDDRRVFVRSGSLNIGPLYPAQPARVLTVDVVDRRFLKAVAVGGYGLGFLLRDERRATP